MTMTRRPVQSREYKVMLRTRGFNGDRDALLNGAADFWSDFRASAGRVVLDSDGRLEQIKTERLIRFFDTSKHHLNRNGYIFREREGLDGHDREVTLKFRHADRFVTLDRSMDAAGLQDAKTKFEEDIKGPFLSLYSFSTTVPIAGGKSSRDLGGLARLFPDVARRLEGFAKSTPLAAVNGFTAREIVVEGGRVRIGKHPKVSAGCALIVWYDHAGRQDRPVAVEFSYRYGDKDERYEGPMVRRAFDTFDLLQTGLTKWVQPNAGTKTAFVMDRTPPGVPSRRNAAILPRLAPSVVT